MSFRIEHTDPITLLRELPDGLAQTCVTAPRRDTPIPYLLAVLDEVHRVLRSDGTLWLSLTRGGNSHEFTLALKDTRWLRPETVTIPRELVLLSKQAEFSFHPPHPAPASYTAQSVLCPRYPAAQRPGDRCQRCPIPRRGWCVPSPGAAGIPPREVIEWCILASTVPCACGVCGSPLKQPPRCGERWRSTCSHRNGRGRCLVIDPFCATGDTGIVAVRRGRQYLGIDTNPANAAAARKRLAATERTR
jgi:hypothetical protein